MTTTVLAMVLLAQVTASGGALTSGAWVRRTEAPTSTELQCTDYSSLFWSVSLKNGVPQATSMGIREHVEPVAFSYTPGPDRAGNRYVAPLPDGWLVGFDKGEFGGGLWWFSRDGRESRRIRPDPSLPVNPDDIFRAENVLGLPEVAGERLVLMGLDHLVGRSGRIFRLVSGTGGWTLSPVAVLDAAPHVWLVEGPKLLFLTESSLWSLETTGGAKRVYQGQLGRFAPTSLVRGPDGALYIGLRHYVLRLEQQNAEWRESWFLPSNCLKVRKNKYRCECVR